MATSGHCDQQLCPHCECILSKKSYMAHKRLYHDGETNQWIKKGQLVPTEHQTLLTETETAMEECDFCFESSDDEDSVICDSPPPPLFDPAETSDGQIQDPDDNSMPGVESEGI